MALSLSEQLQIIDGEINPTAKGFFDLVKQAAIGEATVFQSNHKVTSEVSNSNAYNYVLKMKNAIARLHRNDFSLIEQISRITVSLIGNGSITLAEVSSATESEFLSLIEGNIYSAIEQIAGVSHEEKIDYANL